MELEGRKVALFGAAGAIGQSIAAALRKAGRRYRVVGRTRASLKIARQVGRPLKVRAAGKWMLRLLGLFNPFMREMVEMHYLLTEPVIMDDSALQGLIGPVVKTPYPEGLGQTLAAAGLPAAAGH